MAFHTYLAGKCYREYESYKHKEIMTKIGAIKDEKARQAWGRSNSITESQMELKALDDVKDQPATEETNAELEDKYDLDLDDIKAAEEYHYPHANRLNMFWKWGSLAVYIAFNIAYWTAAIVVYNVHAHDS